MMTSSALRDRTSYDAGPRTSPSIHARAGRSRRALVGLRTRRVAIGNRSARTRRDRSAGRRAAREPRLAVALAVEILLAREIRRCVRLRLLVEAAPAALAPALGAPLDVDRAVAAHDLGHALGARIVGANGDERAAAAHRLGVVL